MLTVFFAVQKLLSLMQSHLFIFTSVAFAFGVKLKKKNHHQEQRQEEYLPMFPSRIVMVSGLICKALIRFEFIFVYSVPELFLLLPPYSVPGS